MSRWHHEAYSRMQSFLGFFHFGLGDVDEMPHKRVSIGKDFETGNYAVRKVIFVCVSSE